MTLFLLGVGTGLAVAVAASLAVLGLAAYLDGRQPECRDCGEPLPIGCDTLLCRRCLELATMALKAQETK